ncbi:hypothetical protein RclHR1_10260001 [Rhizophagus clarus]|uniref:G-protein coupled receptors family 1 profile domain-containing protein n=1 Tax=Rhizophagus clarus TaxID=94130 RepID=A0A2Z6QS57_9GLOM|nr:hypothetical protein RclHR1_10260001 [Rhizophagus clarus]GET02825.1 hypothetical protein GLOIN_2v1713748 [Rhizophagus clarus]
MSPTINDCNGTLSYTKLLCRVSGSQLWVYYTTIIICIVVSLFAICVLLYKKFHDKAPLWSDRLFEPITGFLFWVTLHSLFRALDLAIVAIDLFPYNIIFESFINYGGWTFSQFAIVTYIAGTFKIISKLAFHRPTENHHNNVAPLIPGHKTVVILYWTYIIYIGVIVTIFSCLEGYSKLIENIVLYKLSQGILLINLSIVDILCVLGLVKYGRLLVVLTNESVILVSGGKEKQETHKTHLQKLKIINFALTAIVIWCSIISLLWAFVILAFSKSSYVMSSSPASLFTMILSFTTHIGLSITMMASILAIIHGELCPKYMGNTEILSYVTSVSINDSINISESDNHANVTNIIHNYNNYSNEHLNSCNTSEV